MRNVIKVLLFLISTFYMQFGYAQHIKTFVNNACTFYYKEESTNIKKPLVNTVEYVAYSVQGSKPQQDVLLLPDGQVWYNDTNNLIVKNGSVGFTEKNNVYCGVFDGHGIEYDSKETGKVLNNWGFDAAKDVAILFCNFFGPMVQLFKSVDDTILENNYSANGGTTACVCKIDPNDTVDIFNVGDSRAVWGLDSNEHTIDHDFNHPKEAERMQEIENIVKKLENNGDDSIMDGQIVINSPDYIYYAEASQLKVLRSFGHKNMRQIKQIRKKNNNNEFVELQESIELINAIPDEYENIKSPLVFIGSDGCFDYASNKGIYTICKALFEKGESLDFVAYAILTYICISEENNKKSTIDSAIDDTNVKSVIKQYTNTNLKVDITSKCQDLHDNTSFILLHIKKNESNVEPESTWHFMPVNKERAILLLLLLMGVCGKYLIAYK